MLHLQEGPAGWTRTEQDIPVQLAALTGGASAPTAGWPLDDHAELRSPVASPHRLQARFWLPTDATLELIFESRDGIASVMAKRQDPAMVRYFAGQGGRRLEPQTCDDPLRLPPADQPIDLTLDLSGRTPQVTLNGVVAHCGTPSATAWTSARVRAGVRQVKLLELRASGLGEPHVQTAPPLPIWTLGLGGVLGAALLLAAGGSLGFRRMVGVASPLVLVPVLAWADLPAMLQSARIVAVHPALWAMGLPLALSLGLGLLSLAVRLSHRDNTLPIGFSAACGAALGGVAVPVYGPVIGGVMVGGSALAGVIFVVLGRRLWGLDRGVGWGLVSATVLGLAAGAAALAMAPRHPMAAIFATEAGAVCGLVVWANVRHVRGFNLVSLAGVALVASLLNTALLWTDYGGRVLGRSARAETQTPDAHGQDVDREGRTGAWESFSQLEITQNHPEYPAFGYPVVPAPRRPGAVRVVAMGGSSTGGAWQNDDLDEFWPAELERQLGDRVQVVNQGVGGWTSFHARRYLQTRWDDVDPDIVVMYVGHNDLNTRTPVTYARLFAAWQRRDDWRTRASARLGDVALYQAVRFGLLAVLRPPNTRAVIPSEFDENISIIESLLRPRGGRLVLALEGISPLPDGLQAWADVMKTHAKADDVAFVDTAAALDEPGMEQAFLDSCHLSPLGHRTVAEKVGETLVLEGFIPDQ